MADKASRRGAANVGALMMILAFVAMGLFLYWLNIQSQKQKAVEIREDSAAIAANAAQSEAVPGAQLVAATDLVSPAKYDNQLIQVHGLSVGSQLGQQGFWLGLPSGSALLVALTPALIQQKVQAPTGDTAMVVGTVHMMTDSIIGSWVKAGTINRQDSVAAASAEYFLEARQVKATGGATSGGSSGSS